MKAFLMYRDRDFDLQDESLPNEQDLVQDLELNSLFNAMSCGDRLLFEVTKKSVLSSVRNDLDTILYRQNILRDCLKNASVVTKIYDLAVEAIANEKKIYFGVITYPASLLRRSRETLQMFVSMLERLRKIADEHADQFESEGFSRFFAMLTEELSDGYFNLVQRHLDELRFRDGVLISAELGKGNKGTDYILRKPDRKSRWGEGIFGAKQRTLYINNHDNSGAKVLSELRDRGINLAANALAQSADHILSFFNMLRTELAFYIGCLNLHQQLAQLEVPVCFPFPAAASERRHSFKGLYDVCLTLTMKQRIVGNDVQADGKDLVIITGANQGGKSTFLRSIGLSQLMMQSGLFVPAESFCSNVCDGIFTHFKREEDAMMNSGKLDEELSRMSAIIDQLTPNSMILLNESLAATNEREGSELAGQIIHALIENHIKVFFVTHLYEFAHRFYDEKMDRVIFLRAERLADGERTFRMINGEPLQTSYGKDLYNRVFEVNDTVTNRKDAVLC